MQPPRPHSEGPPRSRRHLKILLTFEQGVLPFHFVVNLATYVASIGREECEELRRPWVLQSLTPSLGTHVVSKKKERGNWIFMWEALTKMCTFLIPDKRSESWGMEPRNLHFHWFLVVLDSLKADNLLIQRSSFWFKTKGEEKKRKEILLPSVHFMTECHSTKILVILKKELSLFDLVRDNDVFIWGQTTLKHLGGGVIFTFSCHHW